MLHCGEACVWRGIKIMKTYGMRLKTTLTGGPAGPGKPSFPRAPWNKKYIIGLWFQNLFFTIIYFFSFSFCFFHFRWEVWYKTHSNSTGSGTPSLTRQTTRSLRRWGRLEDIVYQFNITKLSVHIFVFVSTCCVWDVHNYTPSARERRSLREHRTRPKERKTCLAVSTEE